MATPVSSYSGEPPTLVCITAPNVDGVCSTTEEKLKAFMAKHFPEITYTMADCAKLAPDVLDRLQQKMIEEGIQIEWMRGGSGANTTVAVSMTEMMPTALIGQIGNDPAGQIFVNGLGERIKFLSVIDRVNTSRVLCINTVDENGKKNRTMFASFAAGENLTNEDIRKLYESIQGPKIILCDGYTAYRPDSLLKVLEFDQCVQVAITAGSMSAVITQKAFWEELFKTKRVKILIANEDEADALTGEKDLSKALEIMAQKAEVAVITLGAKGCMVRSGNQFHLAPAGAFDPNKGDPTGAGDMFAGGFIAPCIKKLPLDMCARIANTFGGLCIESKGANLDPERAAKELRAILRSSTDSWHSSTGSCDSVSSTTTLVQAVQSDA